jgi:hypothetical protein
MQGDLGPDGAGLPDDALALVLPTAGALKSAEAPPVVVLKMVGRLSSAESGAVAGVCAAAGGSWGGPWGPAGLSRSVGASGPYEMGAPVGSGG